MALSLSDVDASRVSEVEELLVSLLRETYPNLDLFPGSVLRDLVVRPAAMFETISEANLETLRRSQSILAIEEDPALADDELVDAVASNFLLSRRQGTPAVGPVAIVVDQLVTTGIVTGTILISSTGQQYRTTQAYTGVIEQGLVRSATDRLMTQRADGRYVFRIDVQSDNIGPETLVTKGTRFAFAGNPLPRVVDMFADADFFGGQSREINEELVRRLKSGLSAKVISSRDQIVAALREQFPNLLDISVIGFRDLEMRRDAHNLFGLSQGGKVDVYVRTREFPIRSSFLLPAVLDDKEGQRWRLNVTRDVCPGFYRVESILLSGSSDLGSLEILSESREADVENYSFVPDVTGSESAYSRFQTATVLFRDPNTPIGNLEEGVSTQLYDVTLSYMPQVAELQDFISDRRRRSPQADYLVRAAIPCFVGLTVTIERHRDDPSISAGEIQVAAADAVNQVRFFHGQFPVADVIAAIEAVLPGNSSLRLPIQAIGTLRRPDGVELINIVNDALVAPTLADLSISPRTVAFLCRPEDVVVEIVVRNSPEV